MSRVLCEPSFPLAPIRKALAGTDVEAVTAEPPWTGDDVVGVVSFEHPVTAADIGRLPQLRVVVTPSVGFDHLDLEAASTAGVWACNVPDYCIREVADHALALLLSLARGVAELDRSVRAGGWTHTPAGVLRRVDEIRLGIVGFGRIGRALSGRALALGMDVAATDPYVGDDEIRAAGVRPLPLDGLLRWCNAVSVHTPLTDETCGLLDRERLSLLPDGAYVVNVARGPIVEMTAVLDGLASGRIGGAAVDVLDVEPPTPEAPAPTAPRLIVTPHAAWYSADAHEELFRRAAEAVADALAGRRPASALNDL